VEQTRKTALLPTVDRYTGTAVEGWHRGYRAALRLEVFRIKQLYPRIRDEELLDAAQDWISTHSRPHSVPQQLTRKHLSALLAGSPPTLGDARVPASKPATSPRPSVSVSAPEGSQKVMVAAAHRGDVIDISWSAIPLASRVKVTLHDYLGKRITRRRTSGHVRNITFDQLPATGQPLTLVLAAFSPSGTQVAHGHAVVAATAPIATAGAEATAKPADPAAIARERAKLRSELAAIELRSRPSSAGSPKKRSQNSDRRR
jgi:hypothetical protein